MKTLNKIYLLLACLFLMACEAQHLDKDNDSPYNPEQVHLTRTFQRQITYDCDGFLVSDDIVTVNSPTKRVSIQPDRRSNFLYANYYNYTTMDSKHGDTNYHFYIDLSPSLFNLHVERGLNEIEYEFFYCDETYVDHNGSRHCTHSPYVGERGTLYVNVTYSEYMESEVRHRHPVTGECMD